MYIADILIYVQDIVKPYKKTIKAQDREELEFRIDGIAKTLTTSGFFDDTNEGTWFLIPSFQIERVEFNFLETKENETSNEGTNDSESDQDSET